MPKKEPELTLMDEMIVLHHGPHTSYAAAVYRMQDLETVMEKGKPVTYHRTSIVKGPAIHASQIKDMERRVAFTAMIRSVHELNQHILAICQDEEALMAVEAKKSKPSRKRKKSRSTLL